MPKVCCTHTQPHMAAIPQAFSFSTSEIYWNDLSYLTWSSIDRLHLIVLCIEHHVCSRRLRILSNFVRKLHLRTSSLSTAKNWTNWNKSASTKSNAKKKKREEFNRFRFDCIISTHQCAFNAKHIIKLIHSQTVWYQHYFKSHVNHFDIQIKSEHHHHYLVCFKMFLSFRPPVELNENQTFL